VVLDDILELLDVVGWVFLPTLSALSVLQPLFQSPNVVVELLPIFVRAKRTGQFGVATVERSHKALDGNWSASEPIGILRGSE